ncbi:DUF6207 family protein [Streptomyces mordarskii]|uniref:DUF6207 family protein n=1 Tax=Streptomyces mordarskii TaxID=1226758 RepID=UPI000F77CDBA|nr:hypothetical protein EF902_12335 [Streptomyces sp. WAC05858]
MTPASCPTHYGTSTRPGPPEQPAASPVAAGNQKPRQASHGLSGLLHTGSLTALKEAFKEAMAACWDSVADLTGREMDQRGARLRYCLDRRPPLRSRHASRPRAAT